MKFIIGDKEEEPTIKFYITEHKGIIEFIGKRLDSKEPYGRVLMRIFPNGNINCPIGAPACLGLEASYELKESNDLKEMLGN